VLVPDSFRQIDGQRLHNRILRSLPQDTLDRIKPALQFVELRSGSAIDHVDETIQSMYFVNLGLISLVKIMRDGRSVEVGAVGIEGLADPAALFGIDRAIVESMVQIPGSAFRIDRNYLHREMVRDELLRDIIERYTHFIYGQLAQNAACNRLHHLEERCCRWILTGHDSALADSFSLTHEFLAMMLGTPRSSVSTVAKLLQHRNLIDYARGRITVLDRRGLKTGACECYADNIAEIERLCADPD
jgi:CRP-like cAMP-binding protein